MPLPRLSLACYCLSRGVFRSWTSVGCGALSHYKIMMGDDAPDLLPGPIRSVWPPGGGRPPLSVAVAEALRHRYAPRMTPEVEQLRAVLDRLRTGVLKELAGLSGEGARRGPVDSGTNLAGPVQHLTFVESMWFEEIVAGGKITRARASLVAEKAHPHL